MCGGAVTPPSSTVARKVPSAPSAVDERRKGRRASRLEPTQCICPSGTTRHLPCSRFPKGGRHISAQHYGINPELLSLLTGEPVASLPEHVTPSMLPSRYAAEAYRKRRQFGRDFPENYAMLTCPTCGRGGKYDIGAMFVDPHSSDTTPRIQLTGYFRCKHCNGAGDWELPPLVHLHLLGLMLRMAAGTHDQGDLVTFGRIHLHDGFEGRFATDSESHLLGQLRERSADGWLWDRLGNLYNKGGRPDLALVAFEQAIRHDEGQVESHFTLGMLLSILDHPREAGHHLRMVLAGARDYGRVDVLQLREFVSVALRELADLSHRSAGEVPLLPTPEEYGEKRHASMIEGTRVVELKTFDLDMDDLTTFYPLADGFVGRERLAAAEILEAARQRGEIAASASGPLRVGLKIGRNEPCPCGSGKKFKKCCGRNA